MILAKKTIQCLVLVFVLLLSNAPKAHSFCVDEDQKDVNNCFRNGTVCCKTLDFLLQGLEGEGAQDIHIQVHTVIRIESFRNVTIQGNGSLNLICVGNHSGLYIANVNGLVLRDLVIVNCSMPQNSSTPMLDNASSVETIYCAVYVIDSSDLTFERVSIIHSNGTGLVLYNTDGSVSICSSRFEGNRIRNSTQLGGGGLNIEIAKSESTIQATYIIRDSSFTDNYAFQRHPEVYSYNEHQGLGRGGGLFYSIRGSSNETELIVTNCTFVNNKATTWGGGMFLSLRDNPSKGNIFIEDSDFIHNSCSHLGGGGVIIVLVSYDGILASNNITFRNCNFTANNAKKLGGGVLLIATRENEASNAATQLGNKIEFDNCTWYRNEAKLGSAMDIYPAHWDVLGNGILPVPILRNCTFRENFITKDVNTTIKGIRQTTSGVGTLLVSNFNVDFEGFVNFIDNRGGGIYLQSGIISLCPGAEINFSGNEAKIGAAIALRAFSVIYVTQCNTLTFSNNTATIRGGAIYAWSMDQHERVSSRSCFIQTENRSLDISDADKTNIIFDGNRAKSKAGNSIYAASLQPCKCNISVPDVNFTYFNCIANVMGLYDEDITTDFTRHEYDDPHNWTDLSQLVPGYYFRIPIVAYDELGKEVSVVYDASTNASSSIALDNMTSSYISNTRLRLHSEGGVQTDTLLLNHNHLTLSIDITAIECLPGYKLQTNGTVCICDTSKFNGIWKCNASTRVASIINGFWIGLCNNGTEQCTGHCPVGFCNNNVSTELNFRIKDTDKLCAENRQGKLCGECAVNHSVFYHSFYYTCGSNTLCRYGMLFYILSEILPLTIIFIAIIMCNISFTAGAINGIILYAQIFDSFIINFYNSVEFPRVINVLTDVYKFIYTTTNLDYFSIERLSFCLWSGATTLDVIAMKYVTIVYALLLIIVTIFLLNTVRCKKLCVCWRPHNLKNAVIHGFSAFLVMCYSQCAKVSFVLLTTTRLIGYNFDPSELVILYSGERKLFDRVHIRYGLPAIFFMLIIVILPPMALILYPLGFKILGLCHLSELRVVNWIANRIPIQLFDSFQSCYKDNFRFFSGLYFFYRVIPLLLYAINTDMVNFYFMVEVFLIVALALNATLQPYKEHWHNITDSLIFANLAIINAISLYNYQKINEGKDNLDKVKTTLTISTILQLVLIYLPLVYVIACLLYYAVKWGRKKLKERKISKIDYSQETLLDSTYLPPLRGRDSIWESMVDDHPFQEMK